MGHEEVATSSYQEAIRLTPDNAQHRATSVNPGETAEE